MPYQMIILLVIAVGALAVAAYAALLGRHRRAVIGRTLQQGEDVQTSQLVIGLGHAGRSGIGERLSAIVPASWGDDEGLRAKLIRAGIDSPTAPLTYTTLRFITLVGVPLLVSPLLAGLDVGQALLMLAWSAVAGWLLPAGLLSSRVGRRQERIRRAAPDALDLLVVCIEAGVSLDAALLRVAREIALVHRDLSGELFVVNRKTNAGVPREQALRGLWERTGVEEIRALVSTMIQSEKWGTSIGHVLEVYAETLRRKRRQAVEKKAAVAPLKMLFPLILFILPALFAVVMGPAVLEIGKIFKLG